MGIALTEDCELATTQTKLFQQIATLLERFRVTRKL